MQNCVFLADLWWWLEFMLAAQTTNITLMFYSGASWWQRSTLKMPWPTLRKSTGMGTIVNMNLIHNYHNWAPYRENHVLFVMASDDANWIKSMFNGSDFDVAFTSSAHRYNEFPNWVVQLILIGLSSSSIEPAHFDMTVLSRCNHTIMR